MPNSNDLREEIVRISHLFYGRKWCLATSGNFSARVDQNHFLITASGKDKGSLTVDHIVSIDFSGQTLEPDKQPSAETILHCELYKFDSNIGAILHTHSVYSTVLSSLKTSKAPSSISGYEMLKAFRGTTTHVHTEQVPIFPNDQDMKNLARQVVESLNRNPSVHGFLIDAHGLYSWGRDLAEALRHIEAFEFLFECEYHKLLL
jgi:methylthioribulose-1-phosphate dehydratase